LICNCSSSASHSAAQASLGIRQSPRGERVILVYNQTDDFAEVADKAREFQAMGMYVTMLKRTKKLGKQMDALIAGSGYNYMYSFGESDALKPLSM